MWMDSIGGDANSTNFGFVDSKTVEILSSNSRLGMLSPPSGIGLDKPFSASMGEYAVHNSAGRFIERDSPHPAADYGVAKPLGRHVEVSEWQPKRNKYFGDDGNRFPASITHNLSDGHQHQTARLLIDAYGSEKRLQTSSSKPLLVEPLDINGIDKKTSWQNTQEKEFNWENMSPTLLPSTISFSRERPVVAVNATLSKQDAWKEGRIRDFRGELSLGQIPRFQNQINNRLGGSSLPHDAWKISHHPSNSSQHIFSNMQQARSLVIPHVDNTCNTSIKPSANLNVTRPPTLNPITSLRKRVRNQFEATHTGNSIVNHYVKESPFLQGQSLNSVEKKDASISKIHQLPKQPPRLILSNQQNHRQTSKQQFLPSKDPSSPSQFNHGSSLQPHGDSIMPNPLPVGYTYSISSLMSQRVIALPKNLPSQSQDSVGTEFNPNILKVRNDSVVNSLYGDLPRQCKTCGCRFRSQEEHSSHMDWHVTKNRMSKSRKQRPSRKWFVSVGLWLSGAEALGKESVPDSLPTETIEERKDHEEVAVAAEEDQKTCALCGESFDEFYCDEMEEWMFRGAEYLYAPKGTPESMDRSLLGPIIHAKCRSDSDIQ